MSSITLWPKQQEALEFCLGKNAVALFCEQRTGKTVITLKLIEHWVQDGEVRGLLVGLLNNKHTTWIHHFHTLLPETQTFTDIEEFKQARGHRFLFVHFEQLPKVIDRLLKLKLNAAIIDESHRIGQRSSKQSRAAHRLCRVERRVLLTGTPIEKNPAHLFSQFKFLDPRVFGTRWDNFESEFFDYTKIDLSQYAPGSPQWQRKLLQQRILRSKAVFRTEKLPELRDRLKPYTFRLTQEEVGINHPSITKVPVELTGSQLSCYGGMDQDAVAKLPSGRLVASQLAITTVMKLRQLASGFIYVDESDREIEWVGRAKLDKLHELFDKLSKPVVIFTAFKPDTDLIYKELLDRGYDMARLYGGTSKKTRLELLRKFQRAQYDGIVCQIKTGGVGVDLWKSNNAIVHSMGHSYIDWAQARARLSSVNKRAQVDIYLLMAKDTIDEDLYSLVIEKGLTSKSVLDKLRRRPMSKKKDTKTAVAKEATPAEESFKYSLNDLAEATGRYVVSLRASLRRGDFQRAGRRWGWNTKTEFDSVAKALKSDGDKPKRASKKAA